MKWLLTLLMLILAPSLVGAQGTAAIRVYPSLNEIVAKAPAADWLKIDTNDLLVMDLAALPNGKPRRVIIQLMPAPFSQGWVGNIRKLAAAHWWDGLSINRVQDNYVTQWGDPNGDNPKLAKALPEGLVKVPESEYSARSSSLPIVDPHYGIVGPYTDAYGWQRMWQGWQIGSRGHDGGQWPIHCYGMVGVGRDLPPDTGTGAELYAVIGQAPRHLDRNIALVGRVIEGMEWLSSLPRGHGDLGFYNAKQGDERVPIRSVRLATELAPADQPHFEYLSTESKAFATYANARANRRDAFFIHPAGVADICNVPVPIRRAKN